MAFKWYAVQTYANRENKVKEKIEEVVKEKNLQNKIGTVNVPSIKMTEVQKSGKKKVVNKKLMPGYILVELELDNSVQLLIKNIPNVIGFVSNKPLTKEEMESFLTMDGESLKEEVSAIKTMFRVGEIVKVIDGSFINFSGEIVEILPEKEMLRIKVNIFGQHTNVDVNYLQVASNVK